MVLGRDVGEDARGHPGAVATIHRQFTGVWHHLDQECHLRKDTHMTLEEFATLARAIQSILTPLALVLAAVWAIYTFRALRQVTQSRAQLQKTEAEILDLQREAKIGAVVEMSINTSRHTRPNDPHTYVSAVVEIENKGIRNTRLEHGEDRRPFLVFSVDFEDDGSLKYERLAAYPVPVSRAPNSKSPSTIIRAGGREKIPFYFRVSSPGAYLLVFTAPTSKEEQDIGKDLGLDFPGNWVAKEYLVVERPGGQLEEVTEWAPAADATTKDSDLIQAELPGVRP
jgi:hypothetical protein